MEKPLVLPMEHGNIYVRKEESLFCTHTLNIE